MSCNSDQRSVVEVSRELLPSILSEAKAKRIRVKSFLDKPFATSVEIDMKAPDAQDHCFTSTEYAAEKAEDQDIPAQGQANTVDVVMFSRSQLSHVVDFTISEFAEKRALPASMFSAFTDMAKQALTDAGDGSEDPKDIPQSQVSKVIDFITEGCRKIVASSTKDDV